jgi:hypothetical protein
MAQIPSTINGVSVQFGSAVGNDVDQKLIDGLKHCIKTQIAANHALTTIYISSAYDSHKLPSRHMQHNAVDISRINGTKIVLSYPKGGAIKASSVQFRTPSKLIATGARISGRI